jgi:hypothetical protein
MPREQLVIDGVAGEETTAALPNRITTVWTSAGCIAEITHGGRLVCEVSDKHLVIDGLFASASMGIKLTADGQLWWCG